MTQPESSALSRILVNEQQKILLITNYKCGFISLNQAIATDEQWATIPNSPVALRAWIAARDLEEWQRLIVTREPYGRFLSFYFNFLAENEPTFLHAPEKRNFAFEMLERSLRPAEYARYCRLTHEERGAAREIELIALLLPRLYLRNRHLHPQTHIWRTAGIDETFFTNCFDLSRLGELGMIAGIDIPHANRSSNSNADRHALLTPATIRALNQCYVSDFESLGYSMTGERPPTAKVRNGFSRVHWAARHRVEQWVQNTGRGF